MDYERIEKPLGGGGGGGGFSPGKLRSMLLGMEKKRKEEQEEIDSSAFTCTSHLDDSGGSDHCKDVDVVSVLPECSTDSLAAAVKDVHSRIRSHHHQDHPCLEYDNQVSLFEFQRGETQNQRPHHPQRLPHAPFSKPLPSKWDDAQKWIASPTSNRPRAQLPPPRKVTRQSSTKLLLEGPDYEEPDTKRIDTTQAKKDPGIQKFVSWEADSDHPIADSYSKPVLMIENSVAESAISLSRHDSSIAMQSATTIIPPPSTARSVSMRDMGTEMTPIASQEPSRTGTPVRVSTPIRSPNSSRSSTPGRTARAPSLTNQPNGLDQNKELSEKELQMKTRREIMALGTQLGKMNIAAWASKEEEEDKDASASLKTTPSGQPTRSVVETRAAAWEEAEKAKYVARFKREEMKIQAWENHQKAKTEAEMRKIEVEVERIRGRAQDKLMNKLAAARHKAEEKRAEAEAKRNCQAAKTERQAEYIRRTGRIPSSFSCWSWCS